MIGAMVAGYGSSSFLAFKTIQNRLDSLKTAFQNQNDVKRDVEYARAAFSEISTVDEMLDDPRLLNVATTAFGLEDKAFAKAFLRKVLVEGTNDSDDLARRLVDPRYRNFSKFVGASEDGAVKNFAQASWRDGLLDKYMTMRFESEVGASNPAVQTALYFQRKAGDVDSYYDILGDKEMYTVVRTMLGLPSSYSNVSIDSQLAKLESKVDLEDFKSPAKVARMIDRYLAMSDSQNVSLGSSSNPGAIALQTFAGGAMTGYGPIVSIDPTLLIR